MSEIWSKIIAFFMALMGVIGSVPAQTQTQIPENAQTHEIVVMSYNVYIEGTGRKSPENRSEGVISIIRNEMPDVFGLQEADEAWMNRIKNGMPEYTAVGRGRGKTETEGEYSPVFFKTDKYDLVDSGTFWFSDTPEKSSLTWGALFRRISTWAVLRDKATGFDFAVFNSHWDHISVISRNKSAELLVEKAKEYAPGLPVVIIGDFNCEADTVAYKNLIDAGFVDSMYVADETTDIGTYHGYTKDSTEGVMPIDHILFLDEYGFAQSYRVITDKYDGIYPSDHLPIVSNIILYK